MLPDDIDILALSSAYQQKVELCEIEDNMDEANYWRNVFMDLSSNSRYANAVSELTLIANRRNQGNLSNGKGDLI